jgi:hypothetical protein
MLVFLCLESLFLVFMEIGPFVHTKRKQARGEGSPISN